ncbi:MAG: ATP-binding protein [Gaiellaceae bacterium]
MPRPPEGTVTLLFTDIEGSTQLLRAAGDAYAGLLLTHHRLVEDAIARHGGCVMDVEGDSFFAAFPTADACVAAARDSQQALERHQWPDKQRIRVRMGIHTGSPRLIDGRYIGLDVHHAARVMSAAHGGQTVLSQQAHDALEAQWTMRDLGDHRLKDLLGPQRLSQLAVDGLPNEFPPLKTLGNRFTNLPVLASVLVGRNEEIAHLTELLQANRVVTLTGPGGIGKTRLALQVAAELVDEMAGGVFFVPLAELDDPTLVIPSIARAIGLHEQPGLTITEALDAYLAEREMLLVLDNLEQILDTADDVSRLVRQAGRLRVLATSREPLRIDGEEVVEISPLEQSEAVQLFRSRASSSGVELDDATDDAVAEIVRRLDGIPLAIELAAARVRALSPQVIVDRLDRRLDLLTTGGRDRDARQRTLRATIEWSYDLLGPAEQKLFAGLSVFPGGARLEALEAVLDAELDDVASLVEKSLLRRRTDPDGAPRYWMLETIREYAAECLSDRDPDARAQGEFAAYVDRWAEERAPRWISAYDDAAGAAVVAEETNIRHALTLLPPSAQLRLAACTYATYYQRGRLTEGRELLEAALSGGADDSYWLALALGGVSACAFRLGDIPVAIDAARRAVEEARSTGDGRLLGNVLRDYANALAEGGDREGAHAALDEAIEVARSCGDGPGAIGAMTNKGHLALIAEDWERAIETTAEAEAMAEHYGWDLAVAQGMRAFNTGFAQFQLGRIDEAEKAYVFSLRVVDRTFIEGLAYPLSALAAVAAARGNHARAAFLLGVTDELIEQHNMVYDEVEKRARIALRDDVLAALDTATFDREHAAGRAASVDDVIDSFPEPTPVR